MCRWRHMLNGDICAIFLLGYLLHVKPWKVFYQRILVQIWEMIARFYVFPLKTATKSQEEKNLFFPVHHGVKQKKCRLLLTQYHLSLLCSHGTNQFFVNGQKWQDRVFGLRGIKVSNFLKEEPTKDDIQTRILSLILFLPRRTICGRTRTWGGRTGTSTQCGTWCCGTRQVSKLKS